MMKEKKETTKQRQKKRKLQIIFIQRSQYHAQIVCMHDPTMHAFCKGLMLSALKPIPLSFTLAYNLETEKQRTI